MIDPGHHENAALAAAQNGDTAGATVEAILALASAVNRLADEHQALTVVLADLIPETPPRRLRAGT